MRSWDAVGSRERKWRQFDFFLASLPNQSAVELSMLENARRADDINHLHNMRFDAEIARANHRDNLSREERQIRDDFEFRYFGGEEERLVSENFSFVRWARNQPEYDPVLGIPNRAAWHRDQNMLNILNRIRDGG